MDVLNKFSPTNRILIVIVLLITSLSLCLLSFSVLAAGSGNIQDTTSWTWPIYKPGSKGENIKTIQYMLRAHKYNVVVNGNFDAQTEKAVKALQATAGLSTTGVVDDKTWIPLILPVMNGASGDAVTALQQQLKIHSLEVETGNITLNGKFDKATRQALINYQSDGMQKTTGVADLLTWNNLIEGYAMNDPTNPLTFGNLPANLGPMPPRVAAIIKWAQSKLGTPYYLGGGCQPNNPNNPSATAPFANPKAVTSLAERCDCAALTQSAYRYGGHLTIGHNVPAQHPSGPRISLNQLQPGDLLMPLAQDNGWGHVGMYIGHLDGWGDHMIIVAPHTGAYVRYESLDSSYYRRIQSSRLYWVNKSDASSYWRASYIVRPQVLINALKADQKKTPTAVSA